MTGAICLQGGRELGASCRDLDMIVLAATPMGPVVVLAGAASPGRDHATSAANAARYYRNLSGDPAVPAPDPRENLDGCIEVLGQATMVVLPGGSPTELLRVCTELGDGAVGTALRAAHDRGATLSGASAGAMVLCDLTWLADTSGEVVDGLGFVPGLALPHHHPGREDRTGAQPAVPRWGLPECGGVVVTDDGVVAAGAGTPVVVHRGTSTELARGQPRPLASLPGMGEASAGPLG